MSILTSVAEAQPSDRFPESTTIIINSERYEAFDLGGFKELLLIDADLMFAMDALENVRTQLAEQARVSTQLTIALESCLEENEVLTEEKERYYGMWATENRARLRLEHRPNFGAISGWLTAGGSLVANFVLGILYSIAN